MSTQGIQNATPLLPGAPDLGGFERLSRMDGELDDKELAKVANQMEGVFVSILVKKMREGMTGEGLFGDGPGADVYGGFFDQMMGEELARRGGLGISEMVVRAAMDRKNAIEPEELEARIAAESGEER